MAGTKVSQLELATSVDNDDLLYIVNNGAPRKITTSSLAAVVKSLAQLVSSVNGEVPNASGGVTLTKDDLGLGNVPNVAPVTEINSLTGSINIIPKVNGGLVVTTGGGSIEVSIDPAYEFTWDNLSGNPLNNLQLSTVLAGVGVLTNPTLLDSAPYTITVDHAKSMWVNVSSPTDILVDIPVLDLSIGSVLELRQEGTGTVGITYNNQYMTVNVPTGSVITTSGRGTRIQLVYLGANAWEFR